MNGRRHQRMSFLVRFERESDGYSAYVPALPGCFSQGDTLDEAMENVKEAIRAYLESEKKDHLPLYDPSKAILSQIEVEV